MKEHKKLYKSGKNWVVATLAVASLGVVAMQQGVLADSTPAVTTNTNEQNNVQTAQQEQAKAQADYDQSSYPKLPLKPCIRIATVSFLIVVVPSRRPYSFRPSRLIVISIKPPLAYYTLFDLVF